MWAKCANVRMCKCANGRLCMRRYSNIIQTFSHLHICTSAHSPSHSHILKNYSLLINSIFYVRRTTERLVCPCPCQHRRALWLLHHVGRIRTLPQSQLWLGGRYSRRRICLLLGLSLFIALVWRYDSRQDWLQ